MRRLRVLNRAWRRLAARLSLRRRRAPGPSAPLRALTSAAVALPGLAGQAFADSAADEVSTAFGYSYYREDNIAPHLVAPGSVRERMRIHMVQAHAKVPFKWLDNVDIDIDGVFETMSGASPYYVEPDPTDGDPIQVMSGATIEDQRGDLQLSLNRYLEDGRFSISGGFSLENDYRSGNIGFSLDKHVNQKNATFTTGFTASFDTIEPTDSDIYLDRVERAEKQTYQLFAGLSHVVNRDSLVQLSLTYRHGTGYLTDPYKKVWLANQVPHENRPDKRNQVAILGRFRRHFAPARGSLHFDYRFNADDWDIKSHTFDLSWWQDLWNVVQVVPSFRYYSQSQADFYAAYFVQLRRYYSSDYRLSPYGAIEYGLRIQANMPSLSWLDSALTLGYRRYMTDADWALKEVKVANPGIVSFHLFSVGLTGTF